MTQLVNTRGEVVRNIGVRLLALAWALVILTVLSPVIVLIWAMWFIIAQIGALLGNTWAFENGPGKHLANNLFTWIKTNIRVGLWGNGGRKVGVQWTPSTYFGGRR